MGLIADCDKYFKTKNLYEVLGVDKDASDGEIRKAFRRVSLKYHPDRFHDTDEEEMKMVTSRFQVLAKVNYILADKEKRNVYDASGVILEEDMDESEANWMEYWRCLFPEISTKDIDSYMEKYVGSEEEKNDLKELYIKYEGDLNPISESMIGYDEDRCRQMINEMIESEEVPAFDNFTKESESKRDKRVKKAQREAKAAEREAKKKEAEKSKNKSQSDSADDDLVRAIQSRHKKDFGSLIDRLAAKYGGQQGDEDQRVKKKRKSSR